MPIRRPVHPSPVVVPRSSYYKSGPRHDYGIDDSISQVEYFSNAVLDDTYDSARKSKNRDNELIRNTRAAIISTEQHTSPRAASVSRRVRASTAPPAPRPAQPAQVAYTKVAEVHQARPPPSPRPRVLLVPSSPRVYNQATTSKPVVVMRGGSVPPPDYASRGSRAASLPPRSLQKPSMSPSPLPTSNLRAHRPVSIHTEMPYRARAVSVGPPARHYQEEVASARGLPTSHLHAHRPMVLKKDVVRLARAREHDAARRFGRASSEPRDITKASDFYYSVPQVKARALQRYLYAERGRAPNAKPKRVSLGDFPQVYVPWKGQGPSNRSKAAIIGCKLESEEGARKPPKRPRSQFAANKLREFKIQDIEESIYSRTPIPSGALHASRPPLPKPTDRKAIRDVDGFTKPKNLMSWQYRVESRVSPDDIIYQPASYIRLREQVRDVQEKMDKQRQLLDRYLDVDNMSKSSLRNQGGEGGRSAGGDPDNRPVSALRRKLRRTIARAKNDPDYYRE